MDYSSTYTLESAVLPGVTVTLRKMTEGASIALQRSLAPAMEKLAQIREELEDAKAMDEQPGLKRLLELSERQQMILRGDVHPCWVRQGFVSCEGLTIDGRAATAELIVNCGPRDFYQEILDAIQNEAGAVRRIAGESAQPSTSPAPADGLTSGSGAGSAGGAAATSPATAKKPTRGRRSS
jgi:hypothetical protein